MPSQGLIDQLLTELTRILQAGQVWIRLDENSNIDVMYVYGAGKAIRAKVDRLQLLGMSTNIRTLAFDLARQLSKKLLAGEELGSSETQMKGTATDTDR